MKKVRRIKLDSLQKDLLYLSKGQLQSFLGGKGKKGTRIYGGTLLNTDNGVVWTGDDGKSGRFYGVSFTIDDVCPDDTAYQLLGTIHIERGWAEDDFNIYNFAHEFGHYLQEEEYGFWEYLKMASESAKSVLEDPDNHMNQPYEKDATKRGLEYLNKNLK